MRVRRNYLLITLGTNGFGVRERNLYRVLTVTTGLLVKLLIVPAAVPLVVADHRADDGAWLSSVVTAWDARTPRKYCNGPVSAGLSVVY
ncbi:hypothetical protein GCM10025779_08850 [Arthrobacter cryoconiti]